MLMAGHVLKCLESYVGWEGASQGRKKLLWAGGLGLQRADPQGPRAPQALHKLGHHSVAKNGVCCSLYSPSSCFFSRASLGFSILILRTGVVTSLLHGAVMRME